MERNIKKIEDKAQDTPGVSWLIKEILPKDNLSHILCLSLIYDTQG